MANVQKCAMSGIIDSWCIKPWARCSQIKVQIPLWFSSSSIVGSQIVRQDPSRRSLTSIKWVLSRWCSYNMMISTTSLSIYSSISLLSFYLFCWSSQLLRPCTFHVTTFIIMDWAGGLSGVSDELHNIPWVGSTHNLDIQSFSLMRMMLQIHEWSLWGI